MACTYFHDHMVKTIEKLYPGAAHGKDFLVAQPVCLDTGELTSLPWIVAWKRSEPQPEDRSVHKKFALYEAEIRATVIRARRDACLRSCDSMAVVPPDAPPAVQEEAALWLEYRRKLRDITTQPGFPFDVEWPVLRHTDIG